jgi:hypothetical protein
MARRVRESQSLPRFVSWSTRSGAVREHGVVGHGRRRQRGALTAGELLRVWAGERPRCWGGTSRRGCPPPPRPPAVPPLTARPPPAPGDASRPPPPPPPSAPRPPREDDPNDAAASAASAEASSCLTRACSAAASLIYVLRTDDEMSRNVGESQSPLRFLMLISGVCVPTCSASASRRSWVFSASSSRVDCATSSVRSARRSCVPASQRHHATCHRPPVAQRIPRQGQARLTEAVLTVTRRPCGAAKGGPGGGAGKNVNKMEGAPASSRQRWRCARSA